MSLERKAVRRFMIEALRNRTIAEGRVYEQRSEPLRPDVLGGPALMVYTLEEDAEIHADTPREYLSTIDLAVEVFVEELPTRGDGSAVDQLDDLADQVFCIVEPCIPQLQGIEIADGRPPLSVNPSRSGFDRSESGFDARGRQIMGAERQVYAIALGRPVDERLQASVGRLELTSVTYDFPPPDGTPEAGDDIATPAS